MTNLLERLRAATRPHHDRMEEIFRLPATREEHAAWTATFLGFVEPFERELVAALGGANQRFFADRLKAGWLRADLQALGWSDDAIASVPRCQELPALTSVPRALGALYVFEGSTLGGQMISRHLESVVGLSDGVGYSYFRSYGSEVGSRWQQFRGWLVEKGGGAAEAEIIAAANDTFACLRQWCVKTPASVATPA